MMMRVTGCFQCHAFFLPNSAPILPLFTCKYFAVFRVAPPTTQRRLGNDDVGSGDNNKRWYTMNRTREYLTNLEVRNKLQNVKGKIRLPDVENRFMTQPRTSSDEPIRSNDGLVLPTEKLFTVLVGLYRIYLVAASICIILLAVVFVTASVMMVTDERQEDRDIAPIAVSLLTLVLAVMVVHNIVGWIGVLTFRLRYLWADLWLQCLTVVAILVYEFLMLGAYGAALLISQVAIVVLNYTLIHEIRAANPGQV